MSSHPATSGPPAVLFSAGLDSAVLLAWALDRDQGAQPLYVRAGMAWETGEYGCAERLLAAHPFAGRAAPLVTLSVDMRDVYPATHWAIRGEAPGFDTPDEDVYIEGRNVILLSKAGVYMARAGIGRVLLGPLAGNSFPDATPAFFAAMSEALTCGLGAAITIEAPFAAMRKADVVRLGRDLGVPFERTLSCMQPGRGLHCGRCSKCRERRDGFLEAGVADPTAYAEAPRR
jgi:7-cyano-7-deazaguanine synthase